MLFTDPPPPVKIIGLGITVIYWYWKLRNVSTIIVGAMPPDSV